MKVNYKKNDMVNLTITDLGSSGEGIGKVDGFTLFVKDALIGDEIEAQIVDFNVEEKKISLSKKALEPAEANTEETEETEA